LKTIDKQSWKIEAKDFSINGEQFKGQSEANPDFLIDPQLSMIYMPSDNYDVF
jgi:hypothetical protein